MQSQFDTISTYPTLSDTQRIQARKNAARNIVDKYARKPRREDYDDYTIARYPRWFTGGVALALAFVALAAGIISAFRLYYAGYQQFYTAIPNQTQARIVGVLTPLAAEVLVIIAAVAMQLYLHRQGRAQLVALIPVATGTIVAFVGNWQIAQPSSTWGWVETIFPPVAVLSVAFFFELTLVPELERRQANENAYRAAREEYDTLTYAPEKHPRWQDTYGWSLWEMWSRVYRDAVDIGLLDRETRQLIALREMDADTFFSDDISGNFRKSSETPAVSKDEVIAYLRSTPDAELLTGREIAEITGASEATVSRARRAFSKNGHLEG